MSDESCYYSPGEMPDDDEKENKNASEDPLFRNLMSDFQNEMKTNGQKPSSNREPMKVFLRIRPFSSDEIKASESQGCLKLVDDKTVLLQAPQDSFTFKSSIRGIAEQTHQFSFSKVYDQDTTQKDIFDDSILGYVKDFLDGINCLVFTYGITNSGKTFTIQGNPKNGGILPRTLDVLFNSIKGKQYEHIDLKPIMYQDVTKLSKEKQKYEEMLKKAVTNAGQRDNLDLSLLWKMETTSQSDTSSISVSSSASSTYITANDADYSSISDEVKERVCDGTVLDTQSQGPVRFSIWVSFAEIYNEYIYDLLDPTPSGKGKKRPVLKLGDDKKGNPYVKGLKEIQVNSADEAFTVVRVGQKNQNIAATKLNQNSSRSHSIFTIKILRVVDVEEPQVVRISRLSFVDLAGSERHNKTQSTGNRLKEASNINTSIMTLGKCIEYLRYNQQHKNHPLIVPFRETKLTRLFQGFFLGKGKAAMIVNISQCASVFDETYNVLKFSAIAKQVKTNGARNTELFKPKQLPKPSLSTATPLNANKSNWVSMGLTTPKPVQKAILYESMCDSDDEQYRALVAGYEELRKQLIEERRKNALMELKIREEVCAEMSEQLVEIERDYSARLQEEQQTMEEQCERRIEMLTKSMKKSRKRKKIDRTEDEDDSYVSSILFHAEKVKVKERDETIRSLRAKLAEKEMAHELYKQAHTPDQHPIAIRNLQSDLNEAHETLNLHESHIDELQTKLNTAQDCLEEKDVEIEKLKEMVDTFDECQNSKEIIQLRDLLQKTTAALDEARQKLDQRDEKLKKKDEEITRLQDDVADMKENCASKPELEGIKRELAKLEEQEKLQHERSDFQCTEIKELRREKDDICSKHQLAVDKIDELKRQLEESEDRREQLQFKDEDRNTKIKRFENMIKNYETALAESESIIEQSNEKISQLKTEIEKLQARKDINEPNSSNHLSTDLNKLIEQEKMIENLKEDAKKIEMLKNNLERENRELKAHALDLEKELINAEKGMKNNAAKDEDENLKELKKRLEDMTAVLTIKEKDADNEKKKWETEMKELKKRHEESENELRRKISRELEEVPLKTESNDKKVASSIEGGGNEESEKHREDKQQMGKYECRGKERINIGVKKDSSIVKSKFGALNGEKQKTPFHHSSPRSPFKSNVAAFKEMEKTLKETTVALNKKNDQVILRNQEISELETKMKDMEEEVNALKKEKLSLEKMLEESELKIESFQNELELQVKKLDGKLVESGVNLLKKEEEIQDKKEQNELLIEKNSLLRKKEEALTKKLSEYETYREESKLEVEELKGLLEGLESTNDAFKQEIADLNNKIGNFQSLEAELARTKEENADLNSKIENLAKLDEQMEQLRSKNKTLQSELKITKEQKEEILNLNSELKGLKVENSRLVDDIANKNCELRSMMAKFNQTCEEKLQLASNLHEANESISSLKLQIQLGKTEKELHSMHTKEQVRNALDEASKKEELNLKKFSEQVAERDGIIQGLKNVLEEKKEEIEDLTKRLEDEMDTRREFVKKQRTIHDLRCTIEKKDEELKEKVKLQEKVMNLEDKLKEFDELKCQKETLMIQIATLERKIKERDQQIADARQEIEKLERELKEQIDRDKSFQTPKISSGQKKKATTATPHHASVRRSSRIRNTLKVKKSTFEENESVFNEDSTKKRKEGRKVLFDLNEGSASEVFEADTPGSAQAEKTKRRKLNARNTGICAESPQDVISPSPVKQKDSVSDLLRRQLRSSCRR